MITAHLINDKIVSTSPDAFSLYEKSWLGEKKEGKIEYSAMEALFLLSQRKIQVHFKGKLLSESALHAKARKKDKNIANKLIAYKDLKNKGYVLKTALKFGTDFRVYSKGSKPGESHSPWLLHVANASENMKWQEFSAKTRVAHSTKKKLLIAVVDEESDITYYEISWFRA
ncbi:MAG: tRNA-intron lyase [archaeon]